MSEPRRGRREGRGDRGGAAVRPRVPESAESALTQTEAILRLSRLAGNGAVTAFLADVGTPYTWQRAGRANVQRQHIVMQNGMRVGDGGGPTDNIREAALVVLDRLHETWGVTNAEYATALPAIRHTHAGHSVPVAARAMLITGLGRNEQPELPAPVASNLFGTAFTGAVGVGQPNARADILALLDGLLSCGQISAADHARERGAVSAGGARVVDAFVPATLAALSRFKVAVVAGVIRRDAMLGTRPPTAGAATHVASVLNPGSHVVAGGGGAAPVYVPPPAMVGGGVGGPFEVAMLAALRANVGGWAGDFRTRRAAPPTMPVASIRDLFHAAQEELERQFGPYITAASRNPTDRYHPGSYDAGSKVAAATTRVITPADRQGWTDYWMTLDAGSALMAPYPQVVLNTYHPTDAEQTRVRDVYALGAANVADMDDAIHGWPAESGSPTIYVDEYQVFATIAQQRRVRWDMFTTALHELLHILAHPNFEATSTALGSSAQKFLTEGLLEVLRHEIWDGPQGLAHRLASADLAPLRRRVEGGVYPYDATVISYHADYAEIAQGRAIDAQVGRANTKAAFFMGHTDLLGLGPASPGGARLAGLASFDVSDRARNDEAPALAGESGLLLASRVGVAVASLRSAANGHALTAAQLSGPLPMGFLVRVPGLRTVRAVTDDTAGTIARQNFVAVADLGRANGWVGTTPATPVAPGTRVLIPPHHEPT